MLLEEVVKSEEPFIITLIRDQVEAGERVMMLDHYFSGPIFAVERVPPRTKPKKDKKRDGQMLNIIRYEVTEVYPGAPASAKGTKRSCSFYDNDVEDALRFEKNPETDEMEVINDG